MDKVSLTSAFAAGPAEVLGALTDIRAKIDSLPQNEYITFLEGFFFKLRDILVTQGVQLVHNDANKLRNLTLEIFSRLPQNGIMKDYVMELMSTAIKILAEDNDRNALLAMKIVTELNRTFRTQLEAHVQPLLDCITRVYQNMPVVIDNLLSPDTSTRMDVEPPKTADETAPFRLSKANESLLVLTECPPLVLLLFQLYPRSIIRNVTFLMPVMIAMIKMNPKQPNRGEKNAGVAYRDFFASQVKTLSLVAQLVRPYIDVMRQFDADIAMSILSLLRRCPDDSMSNRKDILASARLFVATDCRMAFLPHLDDVLDGKILFGRHETLKSQSYVVLSDLVSHIKEHLTQSQIFSVLLLFSSTMNDYKLSMATQLTSIRVVLTLVEKVAQFRAEDGISILPKAYELNLWVLRCIVLKYKSMRRQIAQKLELASNATSNNEGGGSASTSGEKLGFKQSENQFLFYHPSGENYIRDAKHVVKTLIWGMRNLFTQFQKMPNPDATIFPFAACARLHSQYFRWALQCCDVFSNPTVTVADSSTSESSAEMKDVLEHFVTSLTVIRPEVFREMLTDNMEFLCERALKENMFLYVVNALLFNEKTTQHAMDLVMGYFVSKLPSLKFMNPVTKKADDGDFKQSGSAKVTTDSKQVPDAGESESRHAFKMGQRSTVLLRLFKFALSSVVNFPQNERFLRSRLVVIVMECVRQANDSRVPITYYYLLRAVFKTISSGKFEESYKAIAALIPYLITGLDSLLKRTTNKVVQRCFLELSILLPARFATLIPFLPNLLGFVSKALKVKGELPQLALRTLEFWIENLNPAFLSSVVSSVPGLSQELLAGVSLHLQPLPYMYGTLALRVFGKLGGHAQPLVKCLPVLHDGVAELPGSFLNILRIRLEHESKMSVDGDDDTIELNFDKLILGACEILCAVSESTADVEGVIFSSSTDVIDMLKIASLAKLDSISKSEECITTAIMEVEQIKDANLDSKRFVKETKRARDFFFLEQKKTALRIIVAALDALLSSSVFRTFVCLASCEEINGQELNAAIHLLQEMIFAVLASSTDPALCDSSCIFLCGVCFRFATSVSSAPDDGAIPSTIFALNNVIIRATSHTFPQLQSAGMSLLRVWITALQNQLVPTELIVTKSPVLRHLLFKCNSQCHSRSWHVRIGGIRMIAELCRLLPNNWLFGQEASTIESTFLSLRNSAVDLICVALVDVFDALKTVVTSCCTCNSEFSKDLLLQMLGSLFSHSSMVRLAAKVSIEKICDFCCISVAELFAPIGEDIKELLKNLSTGAMLHEEWVGVLYGLTFLAKWEISLVAESTYVAKILEFVVPMLAATVDESIPADFLFAKRSSADDPCGFGNRFGEECILHLSTFPIDAPQSLNLRLACVRCLCALFFNNSLMQTAQQNVAFLTLSIQVVLNSFLVQWEELIVEAQFALKALFSWLRETGNRLPQEYLDKLVQCFLDGLADPVAIDVSTLVGLKYFIQSTEDLIDFTQIGIRCVHCLRFLLVAEASESSQSKTVQQNIPLLLMEILNSLPLSSLNGDSVGDVCRIAHAFETTHSTLPSVQPLCNSFLKSTCKFFLRLPKETRQFFINPETLNKPSLAYGILSKLLRSDIDEAKLLASCLTSNEGLNLLFSSVLAQVLDADEGSSDVPSTKRQKMSSVDWFELPAFVGNGILLSGLLVEYATEDRSDRFLSGIRCMWRKMMTAVLAKPELSFWGNLQVRDWLLSLTKSLVTFCKSGFCQPEILLELTHLLCLEKNGAMEMNFLAECFVENVPNLVSPAQLVETIEGFVVLAQDDTMSMAWKSHCLRHLILPLLHATFSNPALDTHKSALSDHSLVQRFTSLWNTTAGSFESGVITDEEGVVVLSTAAVLPESLTFKRDCLGALSPQFLRNFSKPSTELSAWDASMKIEFLKATALFMNNSGGDVTKSIFRNFLVYPWELMRTEELSSIRQWALVNLCHYAATFEQLNPKLISVLYTYLLKTYQVEGKDLFTGLTYDIIPYISNLDAKELIRLMKLTKKILQDEASSSHQHAHVLQIILRHPNVFYPYRSLLASQMLYSISRLGLNPSCSSEIRQVAIGIVDIFVQWEIKRQQLSTEITSPQQPPILNNDELSADFKLTPQQLSITVSFVVRLSLSKETSVAQSKSCVDLFKRILTVSAPINIKVSHFEKMLQGIVDLINTAQAHAKNEQASAAQKAGSSKNTAQKNGSNKNVPENSIQTALELLTFGMDYPSISVQMLNPNLNSLISFFQPIFASENSQLHDIFKSFVVKVVKSTLYTPSLEFTSSYFYRKLKEEVETHLRFGNQTLISPQPSMLLSLRLIHELTDVYPAWIDNHGSSLVRLCQRLLAECVQRNTKSARAETGVDDDGNSSSFQPTPLISVLAEFVTQSSAAANKPNANLPADQSTELALIVHLLLRGVQNGCLEQFKQGIVHIILSIVEGSFGQVLSNIVAEFCLEEIMTSNSHLTIKDQTNLLNKIFGQHDKLVEGVAFSYNIRITALADRIGEKFRSIKNGNGLLLGLLNPDRTVREKCHAEMFPKWGADPFTRLLTFLAADIPSVNHRYWPALLTPIFLDGVSTGVVVSSSPLKQTSVVIEDPTSIEAIVYDKFLRLLEIDTTNQSGPLISDIQELALIHISSGDSIWKEYLNALWVKLDSSNRTELTMSVMKNVSRNRSTKRSMGSSDIPGYSHTHPSKALLGAFLELTPPAPFPVEFLGTVATDLGLCHEVLATIEDIDESLGSKSKMQTVNAMLKLFGRLEDRDMELALVRSSCSRTETDLALSLETYGHIGKAQQMMVHLLSCENPDNSELSTKAFDLEQWQGRWIETAKELSQWDSLSTYSKDVGNVELAMESAAYTCDWSVVKLLHDSPSFASIQERGDVKTKLYDIVLSVIELRNVEADRFCMQSVQLALNQWLAQPEINRGSLFHKNLLHNFQRIIELRESATMLDQARLAAANRPADLSQFFQNWRSRLPLTVFNDLGSEDEPSIKPVGVPGVLGWESLLTWRVYIRAHVAPAPYDPSRPQRPKIFIDSPWDMHKWATMAQMQAYHGSRQNLGSILARDDLQEVFTTTRMKLLRTLKLNEGEVESALQLVSTMNLTHFEPDKRAELLRLKALCHSKVSMHYEAQENFALSVQCMESSAKSWASWGLYCNESLSRADVERSRRCDLAMYSLTCLMKATEFDASLGREYFPRLICLIDSFDDEDRILAKQFVSLAVNMPVWVWLHFIPSLVSCLKRPYGIVVKDLVVHIAKIHPQIVLHHVVSLQEKEIANGSLNKSVLSHCIETIQSIGNNHALQLVRRFGNELSDLINSDKLWGQLDVLHSILSVLSNGFAVRPRGTMLEKDIALVQGLLATGITPRLAESEDFKRFTINLTSVDYGRALKLVTLWIKQTEENRRSPLYVQGIASVNSALFSPQFCGVPQGRVEVPGHILFLNGEVHQSILVQIVRLLPVERMRSTLRLRFLGSDGQTHSFVATPPSVSSTSCSANFKRAVDWSLQRHFESRRRDLLIHDLGESIPLLGRFSMSKSKPSQKSLTDIFDIRRRDGAQDRVSTVHQYIDMIENQLASAETIESASLRAFEVSRSAVPHFLLQYFVSMTSSPSSLFNLRRSLASDIGLHSAMQFIMCSAPISARQVVFSAADKSLFVDAVAPSLDIAIDSGRVVRLVPRDRLPLQIRLTPSITTALTPLLLRGVTAVALGCAFDAVLQNQDAVKSALELMILEHLDSYGLSQSREALFLSIQQCVERLIDEVRSISPSSCYSTAFRKDRQDAMDIAEEMHIPPIDSAIQRLLVDASKVENIALHCQVAQEGWL